LNWFWNLSLYGQHLPGLLFQKNKAQLWRVWFFMAATNKIPYPHPALDLQEQVHLLMQKGLVITDPSSVMYWLLHNSYFRFKHYSFELKDFDTGNYIPGTSFEKIRDLYFFDRKLRMMVFEGLENIEISVKTHISNIMSKAHGPYWYLDPQHFIVADERSETTKSRSHKFRRSSSFSHQKFLLTLKKNLDSHFEPYFKLHKDTYKSIYPPSWMVMEVMTFGTVSRMFENLRPSPEKTRICEAFGLTKKLLVSWLHCFSFIRNKCAHHNKLTYSKIRFAPVIPKNPARKFLAVDDFDNTSLYAILSCIQYMLTICNKDSIFKYDLLKLFQKFPGISFSRLGFTPNWKTEKIWNMNDQA
jgi:abortive infection bacteriophage resistance protein